MKKNLFLTGILTTAFLFGCSDDVPDKGGVNGVTGDVGYVKVAVNLPTVSGNSVKANGNDEFGDGIEAEYKVNDIILAIFEGGNEADATFKEAQNLSGLLAMQSSGNVTVKYKSDVLEIGKPEERKNVYALAIVNGKGLFSVDENKKLKFGETNFTGKLSDLNTDAKTVDLAKMANVNDKNFLMTNAPITNKPAGNSVTDGREVTTLVKLKVYDTKAKAEADWENADKIYVERAVAKVTTSVKSTGGNTLTISAPGMAYDEATVTFEGWKLNLTNKTYFPVRNVSAWSTWEGYNTGTDVNRFFGETANPYRVYWAIDPNYANTIVQGTTDLNVITELPEGQWNMMDKDEYSAENTTTAGQMYRARLTSVLLKAKFTLKDGTENDNLFMFGTSSAIYSEEQFLKFATDALKDGNALTAGQTLKINNTPAGAVVNDKEGVKGLLKVSDGTDLTDAQAEAILTDCSNMIRFYKGGVMFYYTTVIKHFNNLVDDGTTYDENKHLGLYGVVRNNWYDIRINSVSGPGEPEIPEIPDEPVNKEHSFINAEINILSWAKRTQDVDL